MSASRKLLTLALICASVSNLSEHRADCKPTVFSTAEAVQIAQNWAWWAIGNATCKTERRDPSYFGVEIVVTSVSSGDTFTIDPYGRFVKRWRPAKPRIPSELGLLTNVGGLDREHLLRAFAKEHFSGSGVAEMKLGPLGALWSVLPDGTVVEGNQCALFGPRDGSLVKGYVQTVTELGTVDKAQLEAEEAANRLKGRILQLVGTTRAVRCRPWDTMPNQPEAYPRVLVEDRAGVSRLCYAMSVDVGPATESSKEVTSHERFKSGSAELHTVIYVSAHTARIVPIALGPEERRILATTPSTLINEQPFTPVYPPVVREGTIFLAAAYLKSHLWSGEVLVDDGRCRIEYGGRTIQTTVGQAKLVEGGRQATQLSAPSLMIGETLYLPQEAIEVVTGWDAEYSAAANAVYFTSPQDNEH